MTGACYRAAAAAAGGVPAAVVAAGWWLGGGTGGTAAAAASVTGIAVLARLGLPRRTEPAAPPAPARAPDFPRFDELAMMLGTAGRNPRYRRRVLRPLLAEIAAAALWQRRAIDPVRQPDAAATVLGADAWRLIDPADATDPADIGDGDPTALARAVDAFLTRLDGL